jgi:glycosyltransferase involved in cell wall biosynthesis
MGSEIQHRGLLKLVPGPLRPVVQGVVDPLRRWLASALATVRWAREVVAGIRSRRRASGLTVAVDAAPLWGQRTGIGWYLHCLLAELSQREDLHLRLYGPHLFVHPADEALPAGLPRGPAIEPVVHEVPDGLLVNRDPLLRLLRRFEPWLVAADANRVVFAPNVVPPDKLRRARGAVVATVHDLSFRFFPWTLEEETFRLHAAGLDRVLEEAALVLTDSAAVRRELIADGLRPPADLRVVSLGPGHLRGTGTAELPPEVPERFALHVGTLEPRKNLPMLMAAWERIPLAERTALPLVMCGAVGWKNDGLLRLAEKGGAAGWLVNLGYVSDPVLSTLYRRAVLVCCPSLYEGFGFPVLEAMGAGAPVVASDIAAHRELAGTAAVLLPPDDPACWAAGVAALAADGDRRRDLAARGLQRAAEFSWQRTARETAAAWAEVAALAP